MRFNRFGFSVVGLVSVLVGCGGGDPHGVPKGNGAPLSPSMAGTGGSSAPSGMAGQPPMISGTSGMGEAGGSAPSGTAGGSAGTVAQSGSAGSRAGSGGSGGASAGAGAAGMAGSSDEWDIDFGLGDQQPTTPPDPAMCVDAFCFDIFDCYIFNLDKIDCGFVECVDFVCK
jgi:hypothetical protein